MFVRVVTAPTDEPLSLEEAKLHCEVEDAETRWDALLTALIAAAREHAEQVTRRAIMPQTLELLLPCFNEEIRLPRPPLLWVESVKYIDVDGSEQTVAASDYQVDSLTEPGRVKPVYGSYWPSIRASDYNAVKIRYHAGYASPSSPTSDDPAGGVPQLIKHWMKVRIAQLFEHREALIAGTIVSPLPRDFVDGLLDRYVFAHIG